MSNMLFLFRKFIIVLVYVNYTIIRAGPALLSGPSSRIRVSNKNPSVVDECPNELVKSGSFGF
jgi:hypothetical protein